MARVGGAAEYGLFILTITAALIIDGVLGTSLDISVIRYASHVTHDAQTKIARCQAFAFHIKWIGILCLFLAYLVFQQLNLFPNTENYPALPILFASLGLLLARSVAVDAQIQQKFRLYSGIDAMQGITRILLFGLLAILGVSQANAYSAVYGIVGFLVLLFGAFGLKQPFFRSALPPKGEMARLFRFAGATTFIIAFGTMTGRGDILILSFTQSHEALANYGAASQITQLLTQFALYASVLTQPRIIQDTRDGTLNKLIKINLFAVAAISLASIPFWALGFFDWLIILLFGNSFDFAINLLQIQFIGGLLDLLIVPSLMTLAVLAAPKWCIWGELAIMLAFMATGFLITTHLEGNNALVAMSWTFVGVRVAKLAFYGLLCIRISSKRTLISSPPDSAN